MDVGDGNSPPCEKTPLLGSAKADDGTELEEAAAAEKQRCSTLRSSELSIYISHGMSAWGDTMWQFAVGLYLVELDPNKSLRMTAIFGFACNIAVLILGAPIGDWVDKAPRLPAARTTLIMQNFNIILSALAVWFYVYYKEAMGTVWNGWLGTVMLILVMLFAVIAFVASIANTICVERDWVGTICQTSAKLTHMNAMLRRIDLTTNILAPVLTGQLMTFGSIGVSAIFIGAWNLVSFFIEYVLLWRVYAVHPELATPKEKKECCLEKKKKPCCSRFFQGFFVLCEGWKTYWDQDVATAGIGLALLFMTVMGFHNVTTGFAYASGLTESTVSLFMALAALSGIIGTFTFPLFLRKVGMERTGLFGFVTQNICLIIGVVSIFVPGSLFDPGFLSRAPPPVGNSSVIARLNADISVLNQTVDNITTTAISPVIATPNLTSIYLLLSAIVLSRFGLWTADLVVTTLLVERVDVTERGVVNGVQNALQQFMEMLSNILVILLPAPETFGILIILSFIFVCLGGMCYALYSRKVRGHLFHFDKAVEYAFDYYRVGQDTRLYLPCACGSTSADVRAV